MHVAVRQLDVIATPALTLTRQAPCTGDASAQQQQHKPAATTTARVPRSPAPAAATVQQPRPGVPFEQGSDVALLHSDSDCSESLDGSSNGGVCCTAAGGDSDAESESEDESAPEACEHPLDSSKAAGSEESGSGSAQAARPAVETEHGAAASDLSGRPPSHLDEISA